MSPTKPLTTDEKIDLLTNLVKGLINRVDENHEEVVEKLNNINLGGADYSVTDPDDYPEDD